MSQTESLIYDLASVICRDCIEITHTLTSVKALELSGNNKGYISELLTLFRKELLSAVNRIKKKLECRSIWPNNGTMYFKQSGSSPMYKFDTAKDLNDFEKKINLPLSNLENKHHKNSTEIQ